MQMARAILERITAQAIMPLVTMGVSGAVLAASMELLQSWREQRVPALLRRDKI